MKNNESDILKEIKGNTIYILLEICLFTYNFYRIYAEGNIRILGIIFLILVAIIHIRHIAIRRNNRNEILDELSFMIEFSDSIGYTNARKTKKFIDKSCRLDIITKVYEIDGINVKMQKEYEGRITSDTANGLRVMTCGGSSVASASIDADTFVYDFRKKRFFPTIYEMQSEDERTKVLKIKFNAILSKDESFRVKYVENHWNGAMRAGYDGIVIGEQLFYKNLSEQKITLKFSNVQDLRCEIFEYNFRTNKVRKKNINIEISNLQCTCSIKDKDISKGCIYFMMYKYNVPN